MGVEGGIEGVDQMSMIEEKGGGHESYGATRR